MSGRGVKPEQGRTYSMALTYARQLDLTHLRRFSKAIDLEIIARKKYRTSKKQKRD